MVSSPTEGPWVHFEDWLENELALEKLAETAGSAVYRPLGMEVETEGVFFTAKELLRGVCVGAAAITFLLLIALLLRLVIEVWS
jgi:hypothetical protein